MGYYLQIDTEEAQPLASLTGWGDVIEWANTLPVKSASAIKHLCQYGWQEQVALLKTEIEECLKSHPPKDPQTISTAENLLALLKAHTEPAVVVSVTDGMGATPIAKSAQWVIIKGNGDWGDGSKLSDVTAAPMLKKPAPKHSAFSPVPSGLWGETVPPFNPDEPKPKDKNKKDDEGDDD